MPNRPAPPKLVRRDGAGTGLPPVAEFLPPSTAAMPEPLAEAARHAREAHAAWRSAEAAAVEAAQVAAAAPDLDDAAERAAIDAGEQLPPRTNTTEARQALADARRRVPHLYDVATEAAWAWGDALVEHFPEWYAAELAGEDVDRETELQLLTKLEQTRRRRIERMHTITELHAHWGAHSPFDVAFATAGRVAKWAARELKALQAIAGAVQTPVGPTALERRLIALQRKAAGVNTAEALKQRAAEDAAALEPYVGPRIHREVVEAPDVRAQRERRDEARPKTAAH